MIFPFLLIINLFIAQLPYSHHFAPRIEKSWWDVAKVYKTASYAHPKKLEAEALRKLTKLQDKMIRQNDGSLHITYAAILNAIQECQYQLSKRRWNCTVNFHKLHEPLFGHLVKKGCRETAFIYAIMAASLTREITRGCSSAQQLSSCSCDPDYSGPSGQHFLWGGCSDNVRFGHKFTKNFIRRGEVGQDLRHSMNLHNSEAGSLVTVRHVKKVCICHGPSGSCAHQTCWRKMSDFRSVGNDLRQKFNGATKIEAPNSYVLDMTKVRKRKSFLNTVKALPPTRKDLVYIEETPDVCKDPKMRGTKGRNCAPNSDYGDNCELFCCDSPDRNRKPKYRKHLISVLNETCSCRFEYCCQIHCTPCNQTKVIYKCRY